MAETQTASRGAVVVTGASTGIGRATAFHLDELGFRVYAGVRRESDSEDLIRASSNRLVPFYLDVTDAISVRSAADAVAAKVGDAGLQGLVNNAGICMAGALEFLPVDDLRKQFEVNVMGSVAVTQAFLPLIRRGRGHIINIGSVGGRLAVPFLGAYCASKTALEVVTDALRIELQPWKIRLSLVEPGLISTPMFEKVQRQGGMLLADLPENMRRLYDSDIESFRAATKEQFKAASPPEVVARVVGKALTARRPKTHYVVGRNGRAEAFIARFLPGHMRDAVLGWALGLSKRR